MSECVLVIRNKSQSFSGWFQSSHPEGREKKTLTWSVPQWQHILHAAMIITLMMNDLIITAIMIWIWAFSLRADGEAAAARSVFRVLAVFSVILCVLLLASVGVIVYGEFHFSAHRVQNNYSKLTDRESASYQQKKLNIYSMWVQFIFSTEETIAVWRTISDWIYEHAYTFFPLNNHLADVYVLSITPCVWS